MLILLIFHQLNRISWIDKFSVLQLNVLIFINPLFYMCALIYFFLPPRILFAVHLTLCWLLILHQKLNTTMIHTAVWILLPNRKKLLTIQQLVNWPQVGGHLFRNISMKIIFTFKAVIVIRDKGISWTIFHLNHWSHLN